VPHYTSTDWYRYPLYYDIIFEPDTRREASFLEGVLWRHGTVSAGKPARILEPACGTGRTVLELARRGHRVTGFDASPEMLAFGEERLRKVAPEIRERTRLLRARLESFRMKGPFDLAHCLLSTFKYLLTDEDALSHLRRVAGVLAPGGLYVIGLHLTTYGRRRNEREVWREERGKVRVISEVHTEPPDTASRLEWLRNRMRVRHAGVRQVERLETRFQCRTYNAAELEALIAKVSVFEPVACYDFSHNVNHPRALDDSQEDLVVVLRKN
jgi:SAM-dependent methyltransferase